MGNRGQTSDEFEKQDHNRQFSARVRYPEKYTKEAHVSPHSGSCIFVVDDEAVIASTLAAILRLHGYSATAFTSPLEALAAAQLDAPDFLVSDVAMPVLSGVDLAI